MAEKNTVYPFGRFSWIKHLYQSITRGYSDRDILDPRDKVIKNLGEIVVLVNDFVEYESKFGKRLPEKYATDPAGWLEVLRGIQRGITGDTANPEALEEGWKPLIKNLEELYEIKQKNLDLN